jgi:hypothetical protein
MPANPLSVDLDRLAELARAATPGPWTFGYRNDPDAPASVGVTSGLGRTAIAMSPRYGLKQFEKDAALIAACSPETILVLVERVQRGERDAERMDWLRDRIMGCEDGTEAWRILGLPNIPDFREAVDDAKERGV